MKPYADLSGHLYAHHDTNLTVTRYITKGLLPLQNPTLGVLYAEGR
jgi:hypothetical protein